MATAALSSFDPFFDAPFDAAIVFVAPLPPIDAFLAAVPFTVVVEDAAAAAAAATFLAFFLFLASLLESLESDSDPEAGESTR